MIPGRYSADMKGSEDLGPPGLRSGIGNFGRAPPG